jgi:hypothetical protein
MEDTLCEIRTHRLFQGLPQLPSDAQTTAPVTVTGYRRVTLNLPVELVEQLRNTVYWTPGVTLTGLIKDALHESLERLEQRNGRRYPARLGELKSGRPRKLRNGTRLRSSRPPAQVLSGQGFRTSDIIVQSELVAEQS